MKPRTGEFDHIVVGSGAAGASAARILSEAGSSVAIVEEGPAVETKDFQDRSFPALRDLYRGMGLQIASGRARVPILQGACLGGSTVVNSGIAWRMPEEVWSDWAVEHGLAEAVPYRELERHWDGIERDLGVTETPPAAWGGNARLMHLARERTGVLGGPTRRATPGCRGSSRCQLGCAAAAKQSMLVTYIPSARARGAAVLTGARVDRVVWDGDRAAGVRGPELDLRARKGVLLAASAIQTPAILARSGVRSRHLGEHLQGHPGTPLVGLFDGEVGMWSGATQGYEIDEHRHDGGFKIETIALRPELFLATLPGIGRRWVRAMAEARHAAMWAVALRAGSEGSVRPGGRTERIHFDLGRRDVDRLRRALRVTAELLFAAGAREVLTGVHGLPERIVSAAQVRVFDDAPLDPAAYAYSMSHLFGTARMSLRAEDGVVGPDFAVHGRRGLYVVDSSVFPTNLGVNPQLTIMAVAMHAAERVAG